MLDGSRCFALGLSSEMATGPLHTIVCVEGDHQNPKMLRVVGAVTAPGVPSTVCEDALKEVKAMISKVR